LLLNCKFCNKEVRRLPKDIADSKNIFCSQSCSAKYYNQFRKVILIKFTCENCKQDFEKPKYNFHEEGKHFFCSKRCFGFYRRNEKTNLLFKDQINLHEKNVLYNCDNCQKEFLITQYRLKSNEHHFCNRSCQAIYANKTYNRAGRFGINKSQAETQLVEIIKKDFPDLYIKENDRKVLNGLELDLYIPDKNVGIELNGPCHYIPIFGEEELSKTKNKDIIKKETMQKLKIHFFQINIMGAGKKLPEILNNAYNEYIKPLLV
jgi:hypothetical protein